MSKLNPLTSPQIDALQYIQEHGPVPTGCLRMDTIKALERRGYVQTHTCARYPGELAHHITPEGKAALVIPRPGVDRSPT